MPNSLMLCLFLLGCPGEKAFSEQYLAECTCEVSVYNSNSYSDRYIVASENRSVCVKLSGGPEGVAEDECVEAWLDSDPENENHECDCACVIVDELCRD